MLTPDCTGYRDEILSHFLQGKPLSSEAREHYAHCTDCIAIVTTELNNDVTDTIQARDPNVGMAMLPEATRQALEHGRRVLEREFGIRAVN